ncbi:MAG: Fic family protein [Brevibacterium yomogidense]
MGIWQPRHWESEVDSGVPRRERRSGEFCAYIPDLLTDAPLMLSPATARLLAEAETAVRRLDRRSAHGLASLSRFLLRSEAIASSRIEGLAPSAKKIALAELGQSEDVEGLSDTAVLVANNMTAVRDASQTIADTGTITTDHLLELQSSLLTDAPRLHGVRTTQNWLGGSAYHPFEAEFVPPGPEHVEGLMDDLVEYMNGAAHSPIVQAALAHAQFETIHPLADGNGRVGRAIIHTVLTRRGLSADSILPVSLVLATFRDEYIHGLTAYRRDGSSDSRQVVEGKETWISVFVEAVLHAAERASELADDIDALREEWTALITDRRKAEGRSRALRSDSAVTLILNELPGTPVLTPVTVARIHGVSPQAAHTALETLREAHVLETASIGRGKRAFLSPDLLNLISVAERRLASTQFDTRLSPPNRPVPARPL